MMRHYYIPPAQQLRAGFVIVTLVTGLASAASASARPVRWRSPHVPAAASMRAHLGNAGVELPASFRERTGCTDYRVKVNGRAETLGPSSTKLYPCKSSVQPLLSSSIEFDGVSLVFVQIVRSG